MVEDTSPDGYVSIRSTFRFDDMEWPNPEQMSLIKNKIIGLLQVIYLTSDSRILGEWEKCHEPLTNFLLFEHKRMSAISERNPYLASYLAYLFDTFLPFLNIYVEEVLLDSQVSDMEKIDVQLFNNIITTALDKTTSLSRFFKEVNVENLIKLARSINDEHSYTALFKDKFEKLEKKQNEYILIEETINSIKKGQDLSHQNRENVKDIWQRLLQLFLSNKTYEAVL